VKAVRVNKQKTGGERRRHSEPAFEERNKIMKTLTKLAVAIAILTSVATTQAETVGGYFRSNGTYVMPYYRTPANGVPYDNLSYRGYPLQQPGYISPSKSGLDSSFTLPKYDFGSNPRSHGDCFDSGLRTMPNLNRTYKSRTYDY
jgi:hypothetical protein